MLIPFDAKLILEYHTLDELDYGRFRFLSALEPGMYFAELPSSCVS